MFIQFIQKIIDLFNFSGKPKKISKREQKLMAKVNELKREEVLNKTRPKHDFSGARRHY
jgi:hypothetical protein